MQEPHSLHIEINTQTSAEFVEQRDACVDSISVESAYSWLVMFQRFELHVRLSTCVSSIENTICEAGVYKT